ncbi:MAG: dockerin type I domain-containing protein, partial [Acutalibacteraceae bacterium]
KGCYVTDDDTGLVIDHNITDYSLGGSIDIFAKRPRITTQPSGGHSSVMGDAIVLNIDAENANEYIWHIIDENGKELSWNYLSNNGYANPTVYSGGKMLMLREVSDWMTGKRVYCVVKGYGGTVMSDIVELSVDKVIKYCNDIYFDDFDQIWNHKTVGDFKNPKNDTDAPYTIGNVRWEMFSKILSDDFEFESGDNVAVRIDVIPKEGYTFYSSVFGKLNGIDSYATIKNADGSRSIVFNMTITAPDEYKTQNIELSVAEPIAGKAPATTAKCTSGYAVPGAPEWTPADTAFKSGTQYTVKIPVKAEYEWGDISTVTAKVNGKDAKFIAEHKGGKQYAYYVEYTFDAAKDFLLGDVNNDGKINMLDAILVQKHGIGLTALTDTQLQIADVTGDGNVNIRDAILIQKYSLGLLSGF